MIDPPWDANATLTLPFHPDAAHSPPTTLRRAVESWSGLAAGERDRALLFFAQPPVEGAGVLGAERIADLARRLVVF